MKKRIFPPIIHTLCSHTLKGEAARKGLMGIHSKHKTQRKINLLESHNVKCDEEIHQTQSCRGDRTFLRGCVFPELLV